MTVRGRRVAFLGFAPYHYDSNLLDLSGAQRLVRHAARQASLVVVIIHAGAEGANRTRTPLGNAFYLGEDRGDARRFAHGVIDAGASIVLGSGPHVVRAIERYRGRVVAYSLGNFVGYRTLGQGGVLSESGILRVTLTSHGRVVVGRWLSVKLSDGLPRRDFSNASAKLVAALSRHDFPSGHFAIGPSGLFHVPPQARGRVVQLTRGDRSGYAPSARRVCGRAVVHLSVCVKVHPRAQSCSACDVRAFVVKYRGGR